MKMTTISPSSGELLPSDPPDPKARLDLRADTNRMYAELALYGETSLPLSGDTTTIHDLIELDPELAVSLSEAIFARRSKRGSEVGHKAALHIDTALQELIRIECKANGVLTD